MINLPKQTYTVGMLMDKLKNFDGNDEVMIVYKKGDVVEQEIEIEQDECCVFMMFD